MPNVNAPNTVSFGGNIAQTMIAPDLAAEQMQLARRQQLADFLRQQALAPVDQQTITGSGPTRVVPMNPMLGVVKALQAYLGASGQSKIDERSLAMNRDLAQRYADALRDDSSPQTQSQPVPADPATQPQQAPVAASPQITNDAGAGSDAAPSAAPDAPPVAPPQVAQNAPAPMPPQRAQAPQAAPVGGTAMPTNNFGLAKLLRGSMIEQVGGAPAAAAYWDQAKLPDAVKVNEYYGLPKGDVAAGMSRANAALGQTLVRNGSTLGRTNTDGSFTPMFTAPDTKDNANITWGPNGKPVAEKIQGLAEGVQAISKAREAGAGEVIPYAGVDARGNPLPVTNRTAAATQGQPNTAVPAVAPQGARAPAAQPQTPADPFANMPPAQPGMNSTFSGKPEDVIRSIADMKDPQERANAYAAFADQLRKGNGQLGNGAIYAAPPLGAVTSTDAAQKAPAEQMAKDYETMANAGPQAQQSLEYLDHLLELAKKKPAYMGVGIGGIPGVNRVSTDAAEYEKARASYISAQGKALGASGTDASRATLDEAVPEYGKPQEAMIRGLSDQRNQLSVGMLRRQFLTPIYQAGNHKAYTELANGFDQNISPSLVPLLAMPPGPQRAAQLQAAGKDPAMRAKLNWAAENGLLK